MIPSLIPLPPAVPVGGAEEMDALLHLQGEVIRRGSWKKAEVRLVEHRGRSIVLKDWRSAPAWLRPLARGLFRHEEKIYRALAGVEGVPRLLAAGDRVLALDHVPGLAIGRLTGRADASDLLRRLTRVVGEMHRVNVYHADLRKRDNILVTQDGRIGIVDFASAVHVGRLGPLGWLLRPVLALVDRYAVLKWKRRLCPAELTAAESRLLWRLDALRMRRRDS